MREKHTYAGIDRGREWERHTRRGREKEKIGTTVSMIPRGRQTRRKKTRGTYGQNIVANIKEKKSKYS